MSDTLNLNISTSKHSVRNISFVNPDKIRKKLLDKGYEKIALTGIPIKEDISPIILWIDELDTDFLIEGCQDFEELNIKKEEFDHSLFLGGGLLRIEASINGEVAKITYNYCPGLNKENLICKTIETNKDKYLWQLRNIVYKLIHIAHQ